MNLLELLKSVEKRPMYYRRDGTPIVSTDKMPDFVIWAMSFEKEDRRVAIDYLANGDHLSTVFLGTDYSWGDGPPLLFETMSFGVDDEENQIQVRYPIEAQALAGHKYLKERINLLWNIKLLVAMAGLYAVVWFVC